MAKNMKMLNVVKRPTNFILTDKIKIGRRLSLKGQLKNVFSTKHFNFPRFSDWFRWWRTHLFQFQILEFVFDICIVIMSITSCHASLKPLIKKKKKNCVRIKKTHACYREICFKFNYTNCGVSILLHSVTVIYSIKYRTLNETHPPFFSRFHSKTSALEASRIRI